MISMELRPDFYSGMVKALERWRDRVRKRATDNAITLTLMAFGFALTWLIIIVATIWDVSHGH